MRREKMLKVQKKLKILKRRFKKEIGIGNEKRFG